MRSMASLALFPPKQRCNEQIAYEAIQIANDLELVSRSVCLKRAIHTCVGKLGLLALLQ